MDQKFLESEALAKEICVVVGTRPGIVMMAPVIHELKRRGTPHFVVHTGQHYSPEMDSELFVDLELDPPAVHLLGVGEKRTHAGQTAAMLEGCEDAFLERKPALVLVNGDANTNLAAALAARKLHLGVAHIEAGERSFDWRMPEEHNRRLIDHMSDMLFATGPKAEAQLAREQVRGAVHVTGNTIVDASLNHAKLAERSATALSDFGVEAGRFVLMTSHREENVDDPTKLGAIIAGATQAAEAIGLPVLFVVHPRTRKRIGEFGLDDLVRRGEGRLIVVDAVRYLAFMKLLLNARMVLTDSGGVQQEAHIHRKPCVTLRDTTEWTETLDHGANRLVGADDIGRIVAGAVDALNQQVDEWPMIFGTGKAAERIVDLSERFVFG